MQSSRSRLENRFRDVVLIPAVQILDVQIESAFLHEGFQKLLNQLCLKVADARRLELRLINQVRSARQVDHHARQCFVQGHVCMPESRDSPSLAEPFTQRLTQDPTDVLNSVMTIDLEVSFRID